MKQSNKYLQRIGVLDLKVISVFIVLAVLTGALVFGMKWALNDTASLGPTNAATDQDQMSF